MLTHKGTQIIKTDRLTLRPFRVTDAQKMYDNWASDSKVTEFLTWQPHDSVDSTKALLKLWAKEYSNYSYYNWGIELDGELIGSIAVVDQSDEDERCDIGYCLGTAYWNHGYITEALKSVIDFLFIEAGYNRIQAWHDVNNPASGRAMVKAGMQYEGTLKQMYAHPNGGFRDVNIYSITRSEYNGNI